MVNETVSVFSDKCVQFTRETETNLDRNMKRSTGNAYAKTQRNR